VLRRERREADRNEEEKKMRNMGCNLFISFSFRDVFISDPTNLSITHSSSLSAVKRPFDKGKILSLLNPFPTLSETLSCNSSKGRNTVEIEARPLQ
jgi:hypothetical protein